VDMLTTAHFFAACITLYVYGVQHYPLAGEVFRFARRNPQYLYKQNCRGRTIMNNISPKVQNQLGMLQQIQQQLQTILQQKAQYEMAVREAKRAQEEISDAAEDAVMYMSVGTVMMQKKKDVVNVKLTEKTESLELRIKSLEKQEKMLQGKFEQLQAQIKAALESKGTPSAT
jgi:prefoldin beta subunit